MVKFKDWLQNKKGITNLYTIEGIVWYIESIATFALKITISKTSLLEINVPKDFTDIIYKINKEKCFTFKCPNKIKYSKSLDYYIEYLKYTQFQQLTEPNISKQKDEIVECNERKAADIELDRTLQSQEQKFLVYLKDIKSISETIARDYIYVVNNIYDFCKVKDISKTPIFSISTIEEYNRVTETICVNITFQIKNKSAKYQYGAALNNYREFLTYYIRNKQSYGLNSARYIDDCTKEDILIKPNISKQNNEIMECNERKVLDNELDRTPQIQEQKFLSYLKAIKGESETVAKNIILVLNDISEFCEAKNIIKIPFLIITTIEEYNIISNPIWLSDAFQKHAKYRHGLALKSYSEFLTYYKMNDQPYVSDSVIQIESHTHEEIDKEIDVNLNESVSIAESVKRVQIVNINNSNYVYEKERDALLENDTITFKAWLYNNKENVSIQKANNIVKNIQIIASFALDFHILQLSLLEIKLPSDFIDAINKLNNSKLFVRKDKVTKNKYSTAMYFYLEYLKFIMAEQLNGTNISKQSEELVGCNVRKTPDIELDIISQSQEEKFLAYLKDIMGVSQSIARGYINTLKNISEIFKVINISITPILNITTIKDYELIDNIIWLNKEFVNKNKNANYQYGVALHKYRVFLAYDKNNQFYKLNSITQINNCTKEDIQQLKEPNIMKEMDKLANLDGRKAPDIELDKISQSQEEKFLAFLEDIMVVPRNLAKSYINALKNISESFKAMNIYMTPLLNITTTKDYKLIDNTIWLNKEFVNTNKNANFQCGVAFNKYGLFLDYDKRKNQSYDLNSVAQIDVRTDEETDKEIDINLKESVSIIKSVQGKQIVDFNNPNGGHTKEREKLLKNNMNTFKIWLYNNKEIDSSQTINNISEYIQYASTFVLKFNISQIPLLDMDLPKDCIYVINKLNKSNVFIATDKASKNKHMEALDLYLQYLKFTQFERLNVPNNLNQKDEIVECDHRKVQDKELDITPQNQEQKFLAYLKDTINVSDTIAKKYIYVLKNIFEFCKVKSIHKTPIFNITTSEDYKKTDNAIWLNKPFRNRNKAVNYQYGIALNKYKEFLAYDKIDDQFNELNLVAQTDIHTEGEMDVNLNKSVIIKESAQEVKKVVFEEQDEIENIVKNSEKDLYAAEYLTVSEKIKEFLERYIIAFSITHISNHFINITDKETVGNILKKSFWAIESKTGYFKFKSPIEAKTCLKDLANFDELSSGDTETIILLDDKTKARKIKPINYPEYENVLYEKFPRGFKMNASIELKRFRLFYEDLIDKKLLDDDETIKKTISEIGIEYEDSRIMSAKNAIDENTLSTIFNYIDGSFNSGKVMIYYKSIYEQFQQELNRTSVYNERNLKKVLLYFSEGKYYFKRSIITVSPNTEADPALEMKELLVSNIIPMKYEEIKSEMPHIPLAKLKLVMVQKPEFINTERYYYTHIDCIYLDEKDIEIINSIICKAVSEAGFITKENVIKELKLQNSSIIEKNSILTNLGFGNAIAYYCSDNYDCNGMIFSLKGTNLSVVKIFSNYCLNKDTVYLIELEALAKELGFTTLPGNYLTGVFMDFARINKETFIRKNNLNFNVEVVDSILDKFCGGEYIAFVEVNTFALFPSNEYSWNSFLLESYVKDYSASYRCLSDSISMNKCVGAIVKKDSVFTDYNQVLMDVIASSQQRYLIDNKVALNYLYENGFIAKRRISNIEALIASAKIIREQKGKE
jgi:hypothetical protein